MPYTFINELKELQGNKREKNVTDPFFSDVPLFFFIPIVIVESYC